MKIFIGCSSSADIDQKYIEESRKAIIPLMEKDNELVFGAMDCGIMGEAYHAAVDHNRKITGIAPKLYQNDFINLNCSNEIITKDILERTSKLLLNSDAIVFLPGGIGTLHELITAIELKRSKEIGCPIVIFNCLGFFDNMISMLDKVYDEEFSSVKIKDNYLVTDDVNEMINYLCDNDLQRTC